MNVSLNWLNQYLDRPIAADEAERILTDAGFPLDGLEEAGGDALLDVEVTSNRSDCLSHVGVAREIAAASDRMLIEPTAKVDSSPDAPAASERASVTLDAPDLCPAYTARVITGVKVAPSPPWLVERLESIGLRAVNNVVDATNFVLHELGQPLHAFDLARLAGRRVVIREARPGEAFTALDGSEHKPGPGVLVIADAERPVAVAGVMGGCDSEVGEATTDILLESARFDPLAVRRASRTLKLASDSSYRFERGVDPRGLEAASGRAARLILELAGGTLAGGVLHAGQEPPPHRIVQMRPERCDRLLGIDLPPDRQARLLRELGLAPDVEPGVITCTIPSYRLDLTREADLIEEVARLHGYGHIPVEAKMSTTIRPPQPRVLARRAIGRTLIAHGYHETITFSFLPPDQAQPFREGVDLVRVDEEKKKAEPALRPSVLPSLLACRKANQDAGNKGVRLFEIARAFGAREGAYRESRRLALLADAPKPADALREMRGTLEELLEALGLTTRATIIEAQPPPAWAKPAARLVDARDPSQVIGAYGPATKEVRERFDLQTPVVLAELDYESLIAAWPPQPRVEPLPRFPAIERDLSIIVAEDTPWAAIDAAVRRADPALLEEVEFVAAYRGKPIQKDRKSVTLRMRFRDPARTLRHEEVSEQVNAVVRVLEADRGAELRAG